MSLEYAILGFLQYEPMSGYDLKKMFDISVRHFWPADQSQIYRTLSRLTDRRLVDMEIVRQEERPDRKLYRITDAGKEALSAWLSTPVPKEDHRSAQLIQIFFAGRLDDEQILKVLEGHAEGIRQQLDQLGEIPDEARQYVAAVDQPREAYFWMLTLDAGIASARAQLAWIERVMDDIRNRTVPNSRFSSSNGYEEVGKSDR